MRLGITGHQARKGADWTWVREQLQRILASEHQAIAYSSLAAGSDQLFAEEALAAGHALRAIIPIINYDRYFKGDDLSAYLRLRSKAEVFLLAEREGDDQASFFEAGKFIAMNVDLLVAVWDEQPAAGLGGTADVVNFAQGKCKTAILNPIARTIATH